MEKIEHAMEITSPERNKGTISTKRFLSLDVFRGITICLMIIVNTPGKGASLYPYLIHAKWFGFTLADLVFPSFLFAVGNAMSFTLKKTELENESVFLKRIIQRSVLIFFIGYLMYWFPFFTITNSGDWIMKPMHETRIMGVLQRIALCYLFASLLIHYVSLRISIAISVVLLLFYWVILYVFGEIGQELTMAGNAITKLDVFLLGESHVYKKDVIPFDPEGLLSTLPAIVNVLAGYWVGVFLQQKDRSFECLTRLMITGVILITLGLFWGLVFPISKKLWTSSFVLYTVGIDIMILCVLVYFIEIQHWKLGTNFFNVFGKNPLFIYLLSELLYITIMLIKLPSDQSLFEWISITIFQNITPGALGSFASAVFFMLCCWMAGWWLDKKKVYIRI